MRISRKPNLDGIPTEDTPPGWYACPWNQNDSKLYRYFDGRTWTPETGKRKDQ